MMRDHTHRHVNNLEFDCEICGKIVPGTSALRAHKHRQHSKVYSEVPEDALVCKTCNIQFKSPGGAKYHYKSAHLGIISKINKCGKTGYKS